MVHLDYAERLKETIISLTKWVKVSQQLGLDCYLVDNTLSKEELYVLIPDKLLMKITVLSAPRISEVDIREGGAGLAELLSLKYALAHLALDPDDVIFKSNARYFVRNMRQMVESCSTNTSINFFTYRLVCRAETKFFSMSVSQLSAFINFAEHRIRNNPSLHIEHLFALYIVGPGFEYASHFPVQPVLNGRSGRFGTRFSSISESRINSLIYRVFIQARKIRRVL